VARELRLAPGTVKSRLARGRAAIASALHPDRSEVT
jgi:DNA-directed RNA polymerase specialized sigma24 family protein